jgi:hypothetical protein
VEVTFSELASVEAARHYFEKQFSGSQREQVRTSDGDPYRFMWHQHTDEGYELATMYVDFPYAVNLTADTPAHRDRALRAIDFRHPDKISVSSG